MWARVRAQQAVTAEMALDLDEPGSGVDRRVRAAPCVVFISEGRERGDALEN